MSTKGIKMIVSISNVEVVLLTSNCEVNKGRFI